MNQDNLTGSYGKSKEALLPNPETYLHIIFGSRTGNSKAAAELAHAYSGHLGLENQLHNMQTMVLEDLTYMKNMLIIVSTHGEGDPPAVAENFYNYLHNSKLRLMDKSQFSVLALGDSSYIDYCKTGHDVRNRLLQLGSNEIAPLVECDIDYEENAKKWVRDAVEAFVKRLPAVNKKSDKEFAFEINKIDASDAQLYYAKVLDKKMLTAAGYQKRTLHLALSVENFKSNFQAGDSFGIYAHNSRLLVDKLLKALRFDGTTAVQTGKTTKLLKEALIQDVEITVVTPLILEKYAKATAQAALNKLLENEAETTSYCANHDVLDLVTDFPGSLSPQDFINLLRVLNPRLYSVANSPLVHPGEVHFTVGLMEYPLNERMHSGVCSTFFADRVDIGDSLPISLEANEKFRLPDDTTKPIVMIATGTGVAPFRAFLQARDHQQAKGNNWLFFGDRHADSDFLYREEFEHYFKSGLLTRLNTVFSRDTPEKKYVQQLLLENSKELFEWIQDREAVVYLCGNKRTMGKDVKQTLEQIVEKEAGFSADETAAYMEQLKQQKRLQMDLY